MNGCDVTVSIDRLKPVYIMVGDSAVSQGSNNDEDASGPTEENATITDSPNTQKCTQQQQHKRTQPNTQPSLVDVSASRTGYKEDFHKIFVVIVKH